MKAAAQIKADRLLTLLESCCDACAVGLPCKAPAPEVAEAEKSTTHPFVKRCVAAITQSGQRDPKKKGELGSAFAICKAQQQKSPKAAKAKAKEGVPAARMKQYEKALKQARGTRAKAAAS